MDRLEKPLASLRPPHKQGKIILIIIRIFQMPIVQKCVEEMKRYTFQNEGAFLFRGGGVKWQPGGSTIT